ncbi:hypothetical protein D3C81_1194570 [compost metagenome]
MRGLHRSDHAQPGEAWDVLQRHHLRVLHTPAMIIALVPAQHLFVGVQHDAVAAVTDGVGGHLHLATVGLAHCRLEFFRRGHQQSAVVRVVAVVSQHRRATAAKRAIHEQLHAVHLQPATGVGVETALAQVVERALVAVGIGIDAQRQLALVGQPLHQRQVLPRHAHVVHAGQAIAHRRLQRGQQALLAGCILHRRDMRADQHGSAIDQHTGRLTSGIAHDAPTFRLPVTTQ